MDKARARVFMTVIIGVGLGGVYVQNEGNCTNIDWAGCTGVDPRRTRRYQRMEFAPVEPLADRPPFDRLRAGPAWTRDRPARVGGHRGFSP